MRNDNILPQAAAGKSSPVVTVVTTNDDTSARKERMENRNEDCFPTFDEAYKVKRELEDGFLKHICSLESIGIKLDNGWKICISLDSESERKSTDWEEIRKHILKMNQSLRRFIFQETHSSALVKKGGPLRNEESQPGEHSFSPSSLRTPIQVSFEPLQNNGGTLAKLASLIPDPLAVPAPISVASHIYMYPQKPDKTAIPGQGTICCFLDNRSFLTAGHVVLPENGQTRDSCFLLNNNNPIPIGFLPSPQFARQDMYLDAALVTINPAATIVGGTNVSANKPFRCLSLQMFGSINHSNVMIRTPHGVQLGIVDDWSATRDSNGADYVRDHIQVSGLQTVNGDSGSPLLWEDDNGELYLVGLLRGTVNLGHRLIDLFVPVGKILTEFQVSLS